MLFTEYQKRYGMEDISILTDKDYSFFNKKVFNDDGKTFKSLINNPNNHILIFNKGIVIFTVYEAENIDGFNDDRIALVYLLYKAKDSKIDWNIAYNDFLEGLKLNGCTKMIMSTRIKPEFWINNYKFKLRKYEMELDL